MEISFTPSPDVVVILNALIDKLENRSKRVPVVSEAEGIYHATRPPRCELKDIDLPEYFSQTTPLPRLITNEQLQTLEQIGAIKLAWHPGESGHLLKSVTLQTKHREASPWDVPRNLEFAPVPDGKVSGKIWNSKLASRSTQYESLYTLLKRIPIAHHRANLESLLLAEKFRYQKSDWRARALDYILTQLHAGKSPSPFSLTDSDFNHDLLAILQSLSALIAETPCRVFSVRVFNDTKRFDDLRSALVRIARRANAEWKSLTNEDLLRELNLVANPTYIYLSGNWELTDINGQIINLDSFSPSVGFPASQIASIQRVSIHAESVLCIENLTSFHEFTRASGTNLTQYAAICLMGNPSPSIRGLLCLIPDEMPIYLWSDMDYGGFNILSQLRKQANPHTQPYLMDITTFEKYAHLSRPLTQVDTRNLNRLTRNPDLKDIHLTIEHILKRGLKLEQEAIHA